MRLLFFALKYHWLDVAKQLCERQKPEHVIWLQYPEDPEIPQELLSYPHTIVKLNYSDPTRCTINGVQLEHGALLNLSELRDFSAVENQYLRLLDRYLFFSRTHENRKWHYLRNLEFVKELLTSFKVDVIVSHNFPHTAYDYLIYNMAKKLGKPYFYCYQLPFDDMTVVTDRLMSEPERFDIDKDFPMSIKIHPNITRYVENIRSKFDQPFYMELNKQQFVREKSYWGLFTYYLQRAKLRMNMLKTKEGFKHAVQVFRAKLRARSETKRLEKSFAAVVNRQPDLTKPFVYLALHFQPEATTCPLGDAFVDQELMARILAKACAKHGIQLIVKEHPWQMRNGRHAEFYQYIASLENTVLVPKEFSSSKLIKESIAVASVTGTVLFEALALRKPLLTFGFYLMRFAPGSYPIESFDAADKALGEIASGEWTFSEERLNDYFRRVSALSIEANAMDLYQDISQIPWEVCVSRLANELSEQIEAHPKVPRSSFSADPHAHLSVPIADS